MSKKRPPKSVVDPTDLSGEALALWHSTLTEYAFDDAASRVVLHAMCQTLQRLRDVQSVIATDGLIIGGSQKQPRPHPLLSVEDMLKKSLLAHARGLRLTATET